MMGFSFFLFALSCLLFASKRLMRYLRYLQQDTYYSHRFIKWILEQKAFDKRGTAILLLTLLGTLVISHYAYIFGALGLLGLYLWEEDPRKSGKLKLIMTNRAKRIYWIALLYYMIPQVIVFFMNTRAYWPSQIILFQLMPFFLVAAVSVLSFDEQRRQKRFIQDAKDRLEEVSPYVIGITGSYGKSSTKDALSNVLNVALGATFWPQKGVNTEMGITREIRNHLKKGMRYAVVEMGAYARGSIAKLCRLTPPHAGIITTIGVAHLDRFGSQEKIKEAKSELAQAIPFEGILVCNGDNEGARSIAGDHPKKTTLLYGFDNSKGDLDCWIKECSLSISGTDFVFLWKGKEYPGKTSLMGRAALSNLAASFTMACALGADPEFVVGAIGNLRSVDNRLQVDEVEGVTYLRDAYNSNPDGFSDALDVLRKFEGKKKYLMTPGMIELASLEKELHEKIGRKAGEICDYAIVVGDTNRDSLTSGLLSGGMLKDKVIHVDEREQAFVELQKRLESGDVVLIENDLPDLYKDTIKF